MTDHPPVTPVTPAPPALDWRAEFPVLEHSIFFNHAAVAPLPARAAAALRTFADEAATLGGAAWPRWAERLKHARQAATNLLGAARHEVGFIHNTTHGLLCVANSLPWRPGDNIVSAGHEFPSNVRPWLNLAARGVALRAVPERPDHRYNIDDFLAAIDARTRLIAVSLVQYSTGYRMPVEQLAEVCRARGIWLCLDAIQAVGALPTRVAELGCDFLVADAHKWMLGPEGIGLIYVRDALLDQLDDSMTGWVGVARPWEYDNPRQPPVRAASRFEEGSHNMAGTVALDASLSLLNDYGIDAVWRRIDTLNAQLVEGLSRLGGVVHSPRGDGERSGIVVCEIPGHDPAEIAKKLETAGVHVVARRGWLRLSPHFYNQPGQVDRFFAELTRAIGQP